MGINFLLNQLNSRSDMNPRFGHRKYDSVMGGACSTKGEKMNAWRILVGKPEGKKPLGRPKRRWVDNIKMDLRDIGWDGVEWIDMTQDRDQWRAFVNAVLNLRVP
jgi:hypothetical protein